MVYLQLWDAFTRDQLWFYVRNDVVPWMIKLVYCVFQQVWNLEQAISGGPRQRVYADTLESKGPWPVE